MSTNSWHPGVRQIRALLDEHGFRESPLSTFGPDYTREIGGRAFFRNHPDGRLQMLYVFSWSNFKVAAKDGGAPCTLWVRATLDVQVPEAEAWRTSVRGDEGFGLHFYGRDDWQSACDQFASVIMPILDAPAAGAED